MADLVEVLLVEDNPGDARLAREALRESKLHLNLAIAKDGVEALDVLHRRGVYEDAKTPDLILLDLNLPRKNGREVLADIKMTPGLKRVPVVVLTSSKAEQDVLASYDLHANCYIQKPLDLEKFIEIVQQIETFWFSIVTLPQGN